MRFQEGAPARVKLSSLVVQVCGALHESSAAVVGAQLFLTSCSVCCDFALVALAKEISKAMDGWFGSGR